MIIIYTQFKWTGQTRQKIQKIHTCTLVESIKVFILLQILGEKITRVPYCANLCNIYLLLDLLLASHSSFQFFLRSLAFFLIESNCRTCCSLLLSIMITQNKNTEHRVSQSRTLYYIHKEVQLCKPPLCLEGL